MEQAMQNMREVRSALILRGWHSVADWAKANGFIPITVRRCIYDWWHRTDREPLGGVNRQIRAALKQEMMKPELRRAA